MFRSTAPLLHVQTHLDFVTGIIGEGEGEGEREKPREKKTEARERREGTTSFLRIEAISHTAKMARLINSVVSGKFRLKPEQEVAVISRYK